MSLPCGLGLTVPSVSTEGPTSLEFDSNFLFVCRQLEKLSLRELRCLYDHRNRSISLPVFKDKKLGTSCTSLNSLIEPRLELQKSLHKRLQVPLPYTETLSSGHPDGGSVTITRKVTESTTEQGVNMDLGCRYGRGRVNGSVPVSTDVSTSPTVDPLSTGPDPDTLSNRRDHKSLTGDDLKVSESPTLPKELESPLLGSYCLRLLYTVVLCTRKTWTPV